MKYLKSYVDRHGRPRHYVRKVGFREARLSSAPGTPGFEEEYAIALGNLTPSPPKKARQRKASVTTASIPRWLRKGTGGVYLVKGGQRIKIGYSGDIRCRLHDLQVGSPVVIEFVGAIVGASPATERELHARFAEYHAHGEWFEYGPRLADFVALVRTKRHTVLTNLPADMSTHDQPSPVSP